MARAVGAAEIWRSEASGIALRAARKIWWLSTDKGNRPNSYEFEDWLTEVRLLARCLIDPPDVVHALYGEEHLDLLLRRRHLLRCPLVATFHQPAEQLNHGFEYFRRERVEGIDAAVVVARSEIAKFERWFGKNKVVYVPHGIDTTRFRPDDSKLVHTDKLRLLVVGLYLRDWEVIHRVIDETRNNRLDVQFDVVTLPAFFPYFAGCSNVTLHSGISERDLIGLYQRSDALFLPLKDATANNALLEALACGLPAMVTNVGGISDYLSDGSGWLIPRNDVETPLALIRHLSVDRDLARSKREKARAQALKFDWRRIRERLLAVYSAISAGRPPHTSVEGVEENQ